MPEKGEYVKFKNYQRKMKSPFLIYADFESILVPKDNKKQNPEKYFTNKYQKNIFDDKFSKPFKTYLSEDAAYDFINSMIKESKYCSDVIKKDNLKN